MDYETRVTKLTITPKGDPLFAEAATDVYLEDEAAGEFVVVEQHMEGYGKIGIDPYEWPTIKAAIEEMLAKSRGGLLMVYKDMTFCVGDGCAKFPSCFRALTDIVEANAKRIGLPICQFTAPKSLDCYEPKNKKEHNDER